MLSCKSYAFEMPEISMQTFHDILELREFGLSLPDRVIIKIMGPKDAGVHFKAREEHYAAWKHSNFFHCNFPIAEMNSLLKERVSVRTERDHARDVQSFLF